MPYDNTSYFLKLKVADGMVHSLCSASLSSRTCLAGFFIGPFQPASSLGAGGRGLMFSFNKVSLCAKQLIYVSFISIFSVLC